MPTCVTIFKGEIKTSESSNKICKFTVYMQMNKLLKQRF